MKNRLGFAVIAGLLTTATPSPSPGLDSVVIAPPAGYAALTSSPLHGHFTADDYATSTDPSKKTQTVAALQHDGFVDGFAGTWVNQSERHAMVVIAMAFTGGHGARSWLTSAEVGDKALSTYTHADTITGIDPYYGAHFVDPKAKTYGDGFAFAKGNDVFVVVVVSPKDDALSEATSQTKAQYTAAPNETVPSSQWPENAQVASTDALARAVGSLLPYVLIGVALVALGLLVMALVLSRRRASAGAAVMAAQPGGAPFAVQLSPDGGYWWDGQGWREAAREAPPFAQRSGDGAYWWDGRSWRPVPPPPPAA